MSQSSAVEVNHHSLLVSVRVETGQNHNNDTGEDFDLLACHANHHLNAKTVLGSCGEDFLWHFFGGLHDFRRGTCAFFAVSTLRSRVSLESVHIRFFCRDRDPIKPWVVSELWGCGAYRYHQVQKYVNHLAFRQESLKIWQMCNSKKIRKVEFL